MAKTKQRPIAVFNVNKYRKVGSFIIKMDSIVLLISTDVNGYFTAPLPLPATVTIHINTLRSAEAVAITRTAGSAAVRDLAYDVVVLDKKGLLSYVQALADAQTDYDLAVAIIQASGFDVKVKGKFIKPPLAAKNGKASGQINLVAKSAGARSSYDWAYSLDEGKTWMQVDSTIQAKTSITGLTVGAIVAFRYRPVTKTGADKWSDAVVKVVE